MCFFKFPELCKKVQYYKITVVSSLSSFDTLEIGNWELTEIVDTNSKGLFFLQCGFGVL